MASGAVGVAAGYVAGGQSLTVFVDVDKVDPSRYFDHLHCTHPFDFQYRQRSFCIEKNCPETG